MPAASTEENRPLTAMRGLAIAWIVGHAIAAAFPSALPPAVRAVLAKGTLGIDVSFVLSGFVLASIHPDLDLAATPRFLLRRAARLYPLNIALTAIVAVLAAAGLPSGVRVDWPSLPAAFAMAGAVAPQAPGAWIAGSRIAGLALLCALAFPVLAVTARRLNAWLLLAGIAGAGWGEAVILTHDPGLWWGVTAILRGLAGFALGVACGAFATRLPRIWLPVIIGAEIVAMVGIGAAIAHGPARAVPLWAAALFVLLHGQRGIVATVLRISPLVSIGRISYALFLVHFVILGLVAPFAPWFARKLPANFGPPVFVALTLVLLGSVSALAWSAIEQPARRLAAKKPEARPAKSRVAPTRPRRPRTAPVKQRA